MAMEQDKAARIRRLPQLPSWATRNEAGLRGEQSDLQPLFVSFFQPGPLEYEEPNYPLNASPYWGYKGL